LRVDSGVNEVILTLEKKGVALMKTKRGTGKNRRPPYRTYRDQDKQKKRSSKERIEEGWTNSEDTEDDEMKAKRVISGTWGSGSTEK